MIIDIGTHLRRLVLAGLPLLTAGCDLPGAQTRPLVSVCEPKMVVQGPPSTGGPTHTVAIGFAGNDPRVADLYEACVGSGDYCLRLCQEVLLESRALLPAGKQGAILDPPHRCELACDRSGQPVATVSYTAFNGAAIGRRPEGFRDVASAGPGTSLAEFFAGCAALEGASIAAFAILAEELEHHGAPAPLAARARAAAREETRHFKQTARLAHRFGAGRVRCPRVPARPPRPLAALALENVTEGCVSETFSAVLALWQAAHAGDGAIRTVMAGIAEDEIGHAQLAWDVHAWASARLGPAATAELAAARAETARTLLAGSALPVDPDLVARAGLPDATAATWLARAAQPLWS